MTIDVVIPVYNAPDDLAACVASVLAHTRGDYELVLIDDASPDPRVRAVFAQIAERHLPHVVLLANERNLGFTGTANRGMTRTRRDVVLLNSDTIVTAGWLEALARCAQSDPRIGTVTPFSNNAEICSFPQLCVNQPWPAGADPEPLRQAIAAAAVPCYPDLPTGVGFCMLVRRALIDAVGTFDPAFGAGYGEENDLCMRGLRAGFRNVLCDDAFVLHTGGKSFEGAKEQLGVRNMQLLLDRHPDYLDIVREFVARDPIAALREAARTAYDRIHGPQPGVLHVLHGGGGTEAYVRSLIAASGHRVRHVVAFVRGDRWRIEEHRSDASRMLCEFGRRPEEPHGGFLAMLAAAFGIGVVHAHNLSGDPDGLMDALMGAGVPYGVTVHDLQMACPTITLQRADGWYCGGVTDARTCDACLRAQPALAGVDIVRWRERHGALLAGAAFVIAPSRWAADMLKRYYPDIDATVVPHGLPSRDDEPRPARQVVLMPRDARATVVILGAIGPDKGARRVERLAALAGERKLPVRFVVVGYLDRQTDAWQGDDATLTINGRYDPRDVTALLDYYGAKLVLFPSFGPETFAYTLSEAWSAGRAVLVPPIGALAERVDALGAGWIMSEAEWRDDDRLLERILALVAPDHAPALEAAGARAAAVPLPSIAAMAERTLACYRDAAQAAPARPADVDRLRVAEAFGYRRWTPPAREGPDAVPAGPPPPLAQAALRFRSTRAGRALAKLLPPSARAALWTRLRSH
ncbi:MAG TPA: glycosyltransferase [Casimicrobiaceae bacterium]|nr:glycosyltransferase [Casimicrobiaceae bacterium]